MLNLTQLSPYLPPMLREAEHVKLHYGTQTHGMSKHTLHAKTEGPVLLLIKSDNDLIGAFSSDGLGVNKGYHGNGTCFLFCIRGWFGAGENNDDTSLTVTYNTPGNQRVKDINEELNSQSVVISSLDTDYHSPINDENQNSKIKKLLEIYPSTGKNDYFVLSDHHSLAFGGGGGRFGLWINEDLCGGYSEPCETFGNKHLGREMEFEIDVMQIWGFEM